jgi:hypothetical protein
MYPAPTYFYSYFHVGTHPCAHNHTHGGTDSGAYSDTDRNTAAYSYSIPHAHGHANPNTAAYSYSIPHAYSDTNTTAHSDAYSQTSGPVGPFREDKRCDSSAYEPSCGWADAGQGHSRRRNSSHLRQV